MIPKYTIEPGRIICENGKPICSIKMYVDDNGNAISPAELSKFAREIVNCLNIVDFLKENPGTYKVTKQIKNFNFTKLKRNKIS